MKKLVTTSGVARKFLLPFLFIITPFFVSCSNDDSWSDQNTIIESQPGAKQGLYILNEGNYQQNNSSLSYFDFDTADFFKDYFTKTNPNQGGLGDTGNDLKIYKDKMYAVINNSNYVEVMDAKTAKHIGKITVPNCRYITFDGDYAFVSSYASDTLNGPGYVAKIDINNGTIVNEVSVGRNPEEMTIVNNKLYVANSGGYYFPDYDTTVSVIDLNSFTKIYDIEVGKNLHRIRKDKNNHIWVTSRGDYGNFKPLVAVIDPSTDEIINKLDIAISDLTFYNEKIYFYGSEYTSGKTLTNYGIINVDTQKIISSELIKDGTKSEIMAPYGIIADPKDGSFFIADAMDFVSDGKIYYFSKNGNLKWWKSTGISPGHFAIVIK
ncbi:hypothetical protein Ga0061079_102170 [Apibacter mensalis]|uniref:40-residue YVTN family beta-propeller repeat-containing protein n=1 Tax=Apibacter mensalis TaxID=1586267 RepID=A0A0X8XY66_9FLAO|nr:DUF5074 domain-containing protein [Apibacter mensalis]CVK15619.1 hypothetical protein Ga0061079_102170 [Apibacter mensalis]